MLCRLFMGRSHFSHLYFPMWSRLQKKHIQCYLFQAIHSIDLIHLPKQTFHFDSMTSFLIRFFFRSIFCEYCELHMYWNHQADEEVLSIEIYLHIFPIWFDKEYKKNESMPINSVFHFTFDEIHFFFNIPWEKRFYPFEISVLVLDWISAMHKYNLPICHTDFDPVIFKFIFHFSHTKIFFCSTTEIKVYSIFPMNL